MDKLFDPGLFLPPLIGGGLIGLAAALMAVLNGRVTGVSGILAGAVSGSSADRGWRLAFAAGLLGAPILYGAFDPSGLAIGDIASPPLLALAGALVGVGAGLGSGCTSGHGVCGLARGSGRSLAATVAFMTAAGLTVFILRHVIGG